MNTINSVLDKILSARFIITIVIGITYCKMVHHCVYFFLESMKNSPDKLEAFVTGLIMGFSGIAMLVIKSYFDRTDRPTTQSTENSNVKTITTSTTIPVTVDQPVKS